MTLTLPVKCLRELSNKNFYEARNIPFAIWNVEMQMKLFQRLVEVRPAWVWYGRHDYSTSHVLYCSAYKKLGEGRA